MTEGTLSVRLLGPPEVLVDGRPLRVDTRKAVALLAYLTVTGTPHSRDVLATLLWPGDDPDRARGSLRRTLSTLRAGLGDRWIRADREWVAFEPGADVEVDVTEAARLLGERDDHEHPAREVCARCVPVLSRAAALHRGEFLAGFTLRDSPDWDDWVTGQAQSHRRTLGGLLELLSVGLAVEGRYREAIAASQRWLALDPLDEAAYRQLMLLYAWAGDRASALRQYMEAVRVLDEELGVPPLPETTELNDAILEDDLPPPPAAPRRVTAAAGYQIAAAHSEVPLVGRDEELAAAAAGCVAGNVVVIEGEAGIGKTRLAEEVVRILEGRGDRPLVVRAYEGEAGLAYGLVHDALDLAIGMPGGSERLTKAAADAVAEATRILPGLGELPPSPAPDAPGARSRLLDGVSRVLAAVTEGDPPVLVVDDVHWADEASVELLAYLIRRLDRLGLAVVMAWRTEEVPPGHLLRRVVAERNRAGRAGVIRLGRLDGGSVARLAGEMLGSGAAEDMVSAVVAEAEGLPFFAVEYLTAMREGRPEATTGMADLLETRLAGLGVATRQVASAAAVLGRSFDAEMLRIVCGRSDDEVVTALEELLGRGIVREPAGSASYDFSHEMLRRHVAASTSLARRRLLHGRAAAALAARARRDPAPGAAQIGQHLEAAGREAEAAESYSVAAGHAASLYANREALDLYRRALALGHHDPAGLHVAIGDLEGLSGAYGRAISAYQTALALGVPSARVERKIAQVHSTLGDWDLAEAHLETAHMLLAPEDPELVPVAVERALLAHRKGDERRAAALAGEALAVAERNLEPRGRVRAHNLLGIIERSRDPSSARAHLRTALDLTAGMEEPALVAGVLNNLALAQLAAGEPAEGIEAAEEALEIYRRTGDRHREAALHNNLADLLHAAGRGSEAMSHLKEAVAIFAEVGTEPGALEPGVWKLAEW